MIFFTDYADDMEIKYFAGWVVLLIAALAFVFNIVVFLIFVTKNLKLVFIKYYNLIVFKLKQFKVMIKKHYGTYVSDESSTSENEFSNINIL